MTKAYSYIRFSTTDQVKGDSLRRQIELSNNYAAKHNLLIDDSINLRDLGVSAYDKSNITKGALGRFLDLVSTGKIEKGSFLLIESLDRLSRAQVLDALQVFLSIINADIKIVTLADEITYSRETLEINYQNLILSIFIMSRASEESAIKSHRIRASWDGKRKSIANKRLTSRCPYWLRPTKDEYGFEFIAEHVEVVRRILSMAKNGMGNTHITKVLNQERVKPFSKKSDGWQPSYIQKVLRSPALYGEFQLKMKRDNEEILIGDVIPDYYPSVISKDEWLLINSRREQRTSRGGISKGKSLSNLFSGLLICGHCGGSITMGAHTTKEVGGKLVERKYVGCSRARRGLGCKHLTWSYRNLEKEILSLCKSIDFLEAIDKASSPKNKVEDFQKKRLLNNDTINNNQKKIQNLIEAIELGNASPTVIERIRALEESNANLIDENNSLLADEQSQIIEQKEVELQKEAFQEILKQFDELQHHELLELRFRLSSQIRRVIQSIHLYPGGHWKNSEAIDKLRSNLLLTETPVEEIDDYLKQFEKPNKKERYIVIMFKQGEVLIIRNDSVFHNFTEFSRNQYIDISSNDLALVANPNKLNFEQ